jgi:beta-N-acetylhexosaminidase
VRRLAIGGALLVAVVLGVGAVALSRGVARTSRLAVDVKPAGQAVRVKRALNARPVAATKPADAARRADAAHRPRAVSVRGLSQAQLAGQRIIYAYAGLNPPASLLRAIRAGEAAGVTFFGNNISSPAQIRGVIKQLQRAAAVSSMHEPLLMLADQEGGEVRRLPGPPLLSEKEIGESAHAAQVAHGAGGGAGRNLAKVGMNVNLSPVLDVFRQPGNFIDEYQRSYSSDAQTAARLGASFIGGQQRTGVAATAKHFPGLGAATASQNSDLGAVSLNLPLAELRSVDEAPYRSAIAAGVKLVMTSWATYPALDPKLPAGLSPTVIKGELRGRLKFHGVTVTDAISAGALDRFGTLGQRGVLAAGAGADLILCSAINTSDNTPALGLSVLHAIASALRTGQLNETVAQQAAMQVLALRAHP